MSEPELSLAAVVIPGAKKNSVDVTVNNKIIESKPTIDAIYPTQRVPLGEYNFHDVKIRVIGNAEINIKLQIPSRRGGGSTFTGANAGATGLLPDSLYTLTANFNHLPAVPADKELTMGLFETRVQTRVPNLLGNAEKVKPAESVSFQKEFSVTHAMNEKQEFHFRVFAVTPGQTKIGDKDCVALTILSMEQIHDAAFFQKEYTGVLLEDGQPLPANRAQRLTPPTLTLKCKRAPKTARTFGSATPRGDEKEIETAGETSAAADLATQDKQAAITAATLAAEKEEQDKLAKAEQEKQAAADRELAEKAKKEKESAAAAAAATAAAAAAAAAASAAAAAASEQKAKEEAEKRKKEQEEAQKIQDAKDQAAESKRRAAEEEAAAIAKATADKEKAAREKAESEAKAAEDAKAAAEAEAKQKAAEEEKRKTEAKAAAVLAASTALAATQQKRKDLDVNAAAIAAEEPTNGAIEFKGYTLVEQPAQGVRYVIDVSCKNLVQNDLLSKADPIVAVFGNNQLLDHTETVENEHNPVFRHPLYLVQDTKYSEYTFHVYDVDGHVIMNEHLIGLAKIKSSDLASSANNKSPLTLPLTHPTRSTVDKKLRKKGSTLTLTIHIATESEYDGLKSPVTGNAKIAWSDGGNQNFLTDLSRFFGPERKAGVWPVETRAGYEYTLRVAAADLIKLDFLSASDPIAAIYEKRDGSYQYVDNTEWVPDTHDPLFEKLILLHRTPGQPQEFKINIYDADSEDIKEEDRMGSALFTGDDLDALAADPSTPLSLDLRHTELKSRNKALTKKGSTVSLKFISRTGPFEAGSRTTTSSNGVESKSQTWSSTVVGDELKHVLPHSGDVHEPVLTMSTDATKPEVKRGKSLFQEEIEKKVAARTDSGDGKFSTLDRETAAELSRRAQEQDANISAAKSAASTAKTFKVQQRGEGTQMELIIKAKSLPPCNPVVALYENVEGDLLLLDQTETLTSHTDPEYTKRLLAEFLAGGKQELTFVIYHMPDTDVATVNESDKIGSVTITYQQLFDQMGQDMVLRIQNIEDRKQQNILNKNKSSLILRLLPLSASSPSHVNTSISSVTDATPIASVVGVNTTATSTATIVDAVGSPLATTEPSQAVSSPTAGDDDGDEDEDEGTKTTSTQGGGKKKKNKKKNKKRK